MAKRVARSMVFDLAFLLVPRFYRVESDFTYVSNIPSVAFTFETFATLWCLVVARGVCVALPAVRASADELDGIGLKAGATPLSKIEAFVVRTCALWSRGMCIGLGSGNETVLAGIATCGPGVMWEP